MQSRNSMQNALRHNKCKSNACQVLFTPLGKLLQPRAGLSLRRRELESYEVYYTRNLERGQGLIALSA